MRRDCGFRHRAIVEVFAGNVCFFDGMAVDVDLPFDDTNTVSGNANHTLDVALRWIKRIMKDNDIASLDRLKLVNELVDEDALLVLQTRQHAGAFHTHWLIKKDNEECRQP